MKQILKNSITIDAGLNNTKYVFFTVIFQLNTFLNTKIDLQGEKTW